MLRNTAGTAKKLSAFLKEPKAAAKFALISAAAFLALAIPSALLPNPFFSRMLPPSALDYFFLIATSVLAGLYLSLPPAPRTYDSQAAGGSALGLLSFACPICNFLLVSIFGAAFLLAFLDPARPAIGAISILLLSYAIAKKLEGRVICQACTSSNARKCCST